jgi:mannose/fructose/N-acetylgalactosamine-specific phosphotransferase system component IIC
LRSETEFPLYGAALAAFLVTLPVCNLAAWVDGELRHALIGMEKEAEKAQKRLADEVIPRYLFMGLLLGFLFAFVTLFPVVIIASVLLKTFGPMLPESLVKSLDTAFWLVPVIALADFMTIHRERVDLWCFAGGFTLAILVYLLLR